VPAAAVIPAPIAHTNIAAVKTLVVERRPITGFWKEGRRLGGVRSWGPHHLSVDPGDTWGLRPLTRRSSRGFGPNHEGGRGSNPYGFPVRSEEELGPAQRRRIWAVETGSGDFGHPVHVDPCCPDGGDTVAAPPLVTRVTPVSGAFMSTYDSFTHIGRSFPGILGSRNAYDIRLPSRGSSGFGLAPLESWTKPSVTESTCSEQAHVRLE